MNQRPYSISNSSAVYGSEIEDSGRYEQAGSDQEQGRDDRWRGAWIGWVATRQRCREDLEAADERIGWKMVVLLLATTMVSAVTTTLGTLAAWKHTQLVTSDAWTSHVGTLEMVQEKIQSAQYNSLQSIFHFALQTEKPPNTANDKVLRWASDINTSLSKDGTYLVPSTGYYFTYTGLLFLAPPQPEAIPTNQPITVVYWQELWRRSQSGAVEEPLLKDAQKITCRYIELKNRASDKAGCHFSTVSAILRLVTGDHIYVRASHPDLVSPDNLTSYFGVWKVRT